MQVTTSEKIKLFTSIWVATLFNQIWPLLGMILALAATMGLTFVALYFFGVIGAIVGMVLLVLIAITTDFALSKYRRELAIKEFEDRK